VKPASVRGRLRDVATARIVLLLLEELVDLPDEWLLGLEIEGEERVRDVPLDVVLHLMYESGIEGGRAHERVARPPGGGTNAPWRLLLDKSEIGRTRNGMSRRFGDVRVLRHLLIGATVLAVASLSSLAYASPPDPTWIPGIYDDADFDDVVGLVVMEKGLVESENLTSLRFIPPPALVLLTTPEDGPPSHSVPTLHARAPPSP